MTVVRRELTRDILNAAVQSARDEGKEAQMVSVKVLADAAYLLSDEVWQSKGAD